jgi:hypothetical protein
MFSCSTCGKAIAQFNIKYYTPDQAHFFCDAYCSHDWYTKNVFNKVEEDQESDE